jgi:hypothetical protein
MGLHAEQDRAELEGGQPRFQPVFDALNVLGRTV